MTSRPTPGGPHGPSDRLVTAAPRTPVPRQPRCRRRPRARDRRDQRHPRRLRTRPAPTRSRRPCGTLKRTLKEFSEDNLTDWAAALTYYGVLALFPALIALLSIVGLLTDPKTLTDALTAVVPESAADDAEPGDRADSPATPAPAGFGLILGLAARHLVGVGLRRRLHPRRQRRLRDARGPQDLEAQAAAAADHADRRPVRRRHPRDARAQRPGRRRRSDQAIGIGETGQTIWNIVKWPVVLVVLALMIAVLYYSTPNVRLRGFKWVSPGAGVAIVVAIVASALFAFYVAQLRQLQQDLRRAGRRRRLPDLVLADQRRPAVRHRARRRDRADEGAQGGRAAGGEGDPARRPRGAEAAADHLSGRAPAPDGPGRPVSVAPRGHARPGGRSVQLVDEPVDGAGAVAGAERPDGMSTQRSR